MKVTHSLPLLALSAVFSLSQLAACGKQTDSGTTHADAPSLSTAQDPAALAKAAEAQHDAGLPVADPSTPASSYINIDSGNQLMHLFYAVSGMPPDMSEIATHLSQDYRATQDSFKRQDILKVLEPRVKSDIADAGKHRYVVWEANANLIEHYDFERKLFPLKPAYWKGESNFYYNDNSYFKLSFKGVEKLRSLPVSDEALAREIEDKVNQYDALRLRIYAFVQDTDLNAKMLKSQTVRLELLDKKGRVLAASAL
jgi:hypothetical protein